MLTEEQKNAINELFENAKVDERKAIYHAKELDNVDFNSFAVLQESYGLNCRAKRSGTGITVEITNDLK